MARFASGGTNSKERRGSDAVGSGGGSSNTNPVNTDISWTPPLWLTKGKNHARPRSLVVPIPPVPLDTMKAIQKYITKQQPPFFQKQAQINQIQVKLQNQKEKAKNAQQKLDRLEEDKAERLQEIKVLREEEIEESLNKIEEDMRREHAAQLREQEEEWEKETAKELKDAKKKFQKEQAEEEQKVIELHIQKFEEDQKKKDEEEKIKAGTGDGDDDDLLPSQKLKKEFKAVKSKLDNLKETKKEMVWLLKQVINAENKRKAAETAIPKKKLKL
jgi:hypothetical protein